MSDDDDGDEPAVQLGEGDSVEGAPIARVASRLHYPIERSAVVHREGDAEIRTPAGPRRLESILDESDAVYFDSRRAFLDAVGDVVGRGPVPTTEE